MSVPRRKPPLEASRAASAARQLATRPPARVPSAERLDIALAAVEAINATIGSAVMVATERVSRAHEGTLADGAAFEWRMFHPLFATEDQRAGMDGFLSKPKPVVKHRPPAPRAGRSSRHGRVGRELEPPHQGIQSHRLVPQLLRRLGPFVDHLDVVA